MYTGGTECMQDKLSAEQKHVRQGMQDRMDASIDTGYDGF